MSDQCLGEIRMFAGNNAPDGWAFCNGASLPIAQYANLYSLIGTTYGGDGVTTFNLPDLRGRLPIGVGTATTTTVYPLGKTLGTETVTLTEAQMPTHSHTLMASSADASTGSSSSSYLAAPVDTDGGTTQDVHYLLPTASVVATFSFNTNAVEGSGQNYQHNNVMPCFGINFIIALTGVYPSLQ